MSGGQDTQPGELGPDCGKCDDSGYYIDGSDSSGPYGQSTHDFGSGYCDCRRGREKQREAERQKERIQADIRLREEAQATAKPRKPANRRKDLPPDCSKCDDTGYHGKRLCECEAGKKLKRFIDSRFLLD